MHLAGAVCLLCRDSCQSAVKKKKQGEMNRVPSSFVLVDTVLSPEVGLPAGGKLSSGEWLVGLHCSRVPRGRLLRQVAEVECCGSVFVTWEYYPSAITFKTF